MHVFISDAHIRSDRSERATILNRFLYDMRRQIDHLYILGDLFEFWFEYNIVFPKDYFKTLANLYSYIQDGKKVHYILGNHEVMTGSLLQSFGFIIHRESLTTDIHGRSVYLAHGNKIDRRAWTTVWERLLTSKFNHALYRLIHPDIGVFLAQGIAYLSRKQRRNPKSILSLERFAREKLETVDIVVLAHSHTPTCMKIDDHKYYLNTGDWITNFSYGFIDSHRIGIEYYRP